MLGISSKDKDEDSKESSRGAAERAAAVGRGSSLISRDLRIVGSCETDGRLRIEGTVTGDVTAGALEVASSGSVEGDVTVRKGASGDEGVAIAGTVQGAVRGNRVEVGPQGKVHGGITAMEAAVHGHVRGGIIAERRLVLEETAVVEGDVRARRLALKEGGQVNGDIRMGEDATAGLGRSEARGSEEKARRRAGAGASASAHAEGTAKGEETPETPG